MFNAGNPAFNESTFDQFGQNYSPAGGLAQPRAETMTVAGSIWKSLLLLLAVVAAGTFTWGMTMSSGTAPMPWLLGGALGGLVVALVIIFKPTTAPFLAPVYAVLEGLFLGAISAVYEMNFSGTTDGGIALNGIVVQAVGLTFGVTAAMLILYATRIITVTAKLRAGILAATGGVVIFYVVSLVLSFFMPTPWITSASPLSIGISLIIIAIAAFNLLLDFDLIEKGSAAGAPKYMEWYAAFGLLVTLVWLYLEILRLLAKFQSRD